MMFQWWSAQPVAFARARRTVTATASAEKPNSTASFGQGRCDGGRDVRGVRLDGEAGERPVDLRQRLVRFQEEIAAERDVGEPAVTTSKSATTSLPPGTLYSPW